MKGWVDLWNIHPLMKTSHKSVAEVVWIRNGSAYLKQMPLHEMVSRFTIHTLCVGWANQKAEIWDVIFQEISWFQEILLKMSCFQEILHSKTPHVVTVLWLDSDDVVTILSSTRNLVEGYKTVYLCHLDSYTVTVCNGYLVSSHAVTVSCLLGA